ncbi:hypothetical protein [Tateyamaria pelophila]|nr:hypothetical protein [Tateyamaria pelophila]
MNDLSEIEKKLNSNPIFALSLGSGLIKLDPQPDGCQFDHRQEIA